MLGFLLQPETAPYSVALGGAHGMSSAAYYALKAKYGGLEVSEAKRLRSLEDENGKLI